MSDGGGGGSSDMRWLRDTKQRERRGLGGATVSHSLDIAWRQWYCEAIGVPFALGLQLLRERAACPACDDDIAGFVVFGLDEVCPAQQVACGGQ